MSSEKVSVDSCDARLRGLVLPIGLRADLLEISGEGVEIQTNPLVIRTARPGRLQVTLGEESLAAFLEGQAPAGLRGFKVSAHDGLLTVNAVKTIIIDVKVEAICTLRVVDGAQIYVDIQSVDVMGAGAKGLIQSQLDKLNPVFDAAQLPVPARLLSVDALNGHVVIRGEISPP